MGFPERLQAIRFAAIGRAIGGEGGSGSFAPSCAALSDLLLISKAKFVVKRLTPSVRSRMLGYVQGLGLLYMKLLAVREAVSRT